MKISNHLASVIWGGNKFGGNFTFDKCDCYRYAELSYRVFQLEEEDGSLGPVWGWFDARSPGRLLHRLRFLSLASLPTSWPTSLQRIGLGFGMKGVGWREQFEWKAALADRDASRRSS